MAGTASHTRTITIGNLLQIFVSRLWIIALAFVLIAGGVSLYFRQTFIPQYESTATLYILKQDEGGTAVADSSSFSLALNVVNDCTFSLKSHAVVDQTIDELGLDISYNQLYRAISTNNPEKTRFLQVTVRSDSPEEAKRIVDKLCQIGIEKISGAMGFQQANIFEYGVLNPNMSNHIDYTLALILGIVGMVLVYTFFVVLYIMDDSLRTNEEIEQALSLTFLGKIPNADDQPGGKYSHYGKYGSYGKYGGYGHSTGGNQRKKLGLLSLRKKFKR